MGRGFQQLQQISSEANHGGNQSEEVKRRQRGGDPTSSNLGRAFLALENLVYDLPYMKDINTLHQTTVLLKIIYSKLIRSFFRLGWIRCIDTNAINLNHL